MTASNMEDVLPIGYGPAPSRPLRWLFFIVVCAVLLILLFVALRLSRFSPGRQLTEKERQLLGTWEMQNSPGALARVIYFDERRGMTVSSPPFTTFDFGRWHIDENDHLHSRRERLVDIVLNINQAPLDCHVRSSQGNVILTTSDGAEHLLMRYVGTGLRKLKDARYATLQ